MPIFQFLTDPQGEFRVVEGASLPQVLHPGWLSFGSAVCWDAQAAMSACIARAACFTPTPLPVTPSRFPDESKSVQKRLAIQRPAPVVPVREVESILETIALCELGLPDLRTRMSDSEDFKEHAVWSIRAALLAAFKAGQARGV